MNVFVEHRCVDEPVNAVKMKLVPQWQKKAQCEKPDWIFGKCCEWAVAIGNRPIPYHFIGCPNWNAGHKSANDIVNVLALEHEDVAGML